MKVSVIVTGRVVVLVTSFVETETVVEMTVNLLVTIFVDLAIVSVSIRVRVRVCVTVTVSVVVTGEEGVVDGDDDSESSE